MTFVLVLMLAWAVLSALVCTCVCIAAGRFAASGHLTPADTTGTDEPASLERNRAVV